MTSTVSLAPNVNDRLLQPSSKKNCLLISFDFLKNVDHTIVNQLVIVSQKFYGIVIQKCNMFDSRRNNGKSNNGSGNNKSTTSRGRRSFYYYQSLKRLSIFNNSGNAGVVGFDHSVESNRSTSVAITVTFADGNSTLVTVKVCLCYIGFFLGMGRNQKIFKKLMILLDS